MMQRIIYKYPLQVTDKQELALPADAMVLHVGEQRGVLCVWVDHPAYPESEEKAYERYTFFIRGTGNPFEDNGLIPPTFLGTVIMPGGIPVWHVYYQKEE